MARNRSEKMTPEQGHMVTYLDALRALVKFNLDAGAAQDFVAANLGESVENKRLWKAYQVAQSHWNGEWVAAKGTGQWTGILAKVEAHVKEQLKEQLGAA